MAGINRDPGKLGGVVAKPVLYLTRPEDHRKGERQAQRKLVPKHGHRVPGVPIVARMLVMTPCISCAGPATRQPCLALGFRCPSSVPLDNEHGLIVNPVLLTNLSKMVILF